MKYINEYLEEKVRIKPLGKLKLDEDIEPSSNLSGVYLVIDGYDAGIFVSHADYANWLEQKYTELKYE